jgi:hypothetical protein
MVGFLIETHAHSIFLIFFQFDWFTWFTQFCVTSFALLDFARDDNRGGQCSKHKFMCSSATQHILMINDKQQGIVESVVKATSTFSNE